MDKKSILQTEFVPDEKIANISLYHNSGNVCGVFYPKTEYQLINIVTFLKSNNLPYKVIGNGSNLLIDDKSKLFFVSTKKIKQYLRISNDNLYVSSSVLLLKVYNYTASKLYGGFEALATIPGTIGGAIQTNASCFGQSIFDNLEYIKVLYGNKVFKLYKKDIDFAYHKTKLSDFVILSAKFNLSKKSRCQIRKDFYNYYILRKINQPVGACCGSVFKNPINNYSGNLIELCGLKGFRYKDVIVSPIHANFIINGGNASFDDINYVINHCYESVYKKFNIKLEREVEIIK